MIELIQGVMMKNNPFFVSSKKGFKDNNKPAHWISHSKLRSLDIDELFQLTPKFDEKTG